MKLLSEGLASYVEYRLFYPPGAEEEYQLIAAAARARREVKTEELLDLEKLAAERDENQVYPLGRAFIEVLVRRHGDGAPARVLSALGRKDAPEGLDGALAWQDAFQTAGIDLSQVFDDFFAYLDEQVERRREVIDSLPRPRGAVERRGRDESASGPSWTGRSPRAGRWSAASVRTRRPASAPGEQAVPTGAQLGF